MPPTTSLRFPSPSTHPSPPPAPCPWLWRCHACHIWYRLATTRRCLECDHAFCLSDAATTRSSAKKRKRSGGPCRSEFDYIGWAARGAWRRTLLLNTQNNKNPESSRLAQPPNTILKKPLSTPTTADAGDDDDDEGGLLLAHQRWLPKRSLTTAWGDEHRALEHGIEQLTDRFAEKKEALHVRRRHDCWLHCDFPSECHHAVYKAQQEGKPVHAKARALDRAYLVKVRAERREEEEEEETARATAKGPSGVKRGSEGGKGNGRGNAWRRGEFLMRSSDESSDSDSSDSDLDRDEGVEDISMPDSPPTEDEVLEVIEGQKPVCTVSSLSHGSGHTALDMDGDYSYTAFKKATGVDTLSLARLSAPSSTTQTFEIYEDQDNVISESIPSTAAAHTVPLSSFTPFEPFRTTTNTALLPTSRERSTAPRSPIEPISTPTLDELEQAYSVQAWFPSSSFPSSPYEPSNAPTAKPIHRHRRTVTSSREENTARMMTLLGRRTSLPSSSPSSSAEEYSNHHQRL